MRVIAGLFLVFGFSFGSPGLIDFDTAKVGYVPQGWSVTSTNSQKPGRWQIRIDKTAPSRPSVFAQVSSHIGSSDSSIALYDQQVCKDGDVSVMLKLLSGKMEESAGVVWRFQNTSNYYFAVASASRDTVGVYKKSNEKVSLLAHASVHHAIDPKEWNVMKVSFRGPRVMLFFGHRKLIDAQDPTPPLSGKTGLWTKADTVAYFDNFRMNRRN